MNEKHESEKKEDDINWSIVDFEWMNDAQSEILQRSLKFGFRAKFLTNCNSTVSMIVDAVREDRDVCWLRGSQIL